MCAEPTAKVTVSGNPNSVGSGYTWEGEVVGAGELEHLKFTGSERTEDEIRFLKPWKSKASVSFDLKSGDASTQLTWNMAGSLPWFMFWMKPMMETFIGMDYDRGLKMLKEWIETGEVSSKVEVHGIQKVGPLRMAGVRSTCKVDDVSADMSRTVAEAEELLSSHGLPAEQGMSVYTDFSMKQRTFSYITGFMIPESTPDDLSGLETWSIPSVSAFRVDHLGCYVHLGNGWNAANQIVRYKKLKQSKIGTFEIYRRSPKDTDNPKEFETEIYLPLK